MENLILKSVFAIFAVLLLASCGATKGTSVDYAPLLDLIILAAMQLGWIQPTLNFAP